jgi:hypothetical protein
LAADSDFQIIYPLCIFLLAWEDDPKYRSGRPADAAAMREPYYSEPPSFFSRPAVAWEEELAGALQATFATGTHDLEGIVAALNKTSVKPADGGDWTVERFKAVLKDVGW